MKPRTLLPWINQAFLCLLLPVGVTAAGGDENWDTRFCLPGVDGQVYATATVGSKLYAGGSFIAAGGNTNALNIACWNGTNWNALGGGVNGSVRALAVNGTDLYVGGDFWTATQPDGSELSAFRIIKWNGTAWSRVGRGFDSQVNALCFSGGILYAGGMFTGVGQENGTWTSLNYIAQWNGSVWSPVGGGVNSQVFALAASGANLYAGGFFSQATQSNGSNLTVNAVARWNGTIWTNLSSGLSSPSGYPYASSLAILGSDLYVGGDFIGAGETNANYIARWNSKWYPLGNAASNGVDSAVQALVAKGTDLYVGGGFSTAQAPSGAVTANSVARWNGSRWFALGKGTGGAIYSLGTNGTNVIVGGALYGTTQTDLSKVTFSGLASWDGINWSGLGPGQGLGDIANAIAMAGTNLYVGGQFSTAGKVTAGGLVVWNGSTWKQIGGGMGGTVHALAMGGTNLYAGGTYSQVYSQLHPPDREPNHAVGWQAMVGAWPGSKRYGIRRRGQWEQCLCGRAFSQATQTGGGTVAAAMIARWNGTSWSALGSGTGQGISVNAIAVVGSNTFVGGSFQQIGGVNATNLACWDGVAWRAVGGGLQPGAYPTVRALCPVGTDLYAGGSFAKSGEGVTLNNVARWDGATWYPVGTGTVGTVNALAMSYDLLFAGGYFTSMGGVAAPGVARWDGAQWTSMGSGVTSLSTPCANAFGFQGNSLFIAGSFSKAGAYQAYHFARWTDAALAPRLRIAASANRTVQINWPAADSDFILQQAAVMTATNTWTTVTNAGTTNGSLRTVIVTATNQSRFFRLKK